MLRLIFVLLIVSAGAIFSLAGAFPGLLFYLWNAYFRPDDWTYGYFIASLKLSFTIGAYVVFRTVLALPNPRVGVRTILIWLFFVQATISTFTSETPALSADFLWDFAKVLMITYIIVVLVDTRSRFRWTLVVIGVSLGFEAAKQGWGNAILHPGASNQNPHAFMGDNNGVAMGTFMLVPILGALAQTSKAGWERWGFRFAAIGVMLRGISTYSRGGFLGAAVLGLTMLVRSGKRVRALIAVLALAGVVWTLMPTTYWERISSITITDPEQRDESAAGRIHFWHIATVMASAKPFTGVGLAAYSRVYPRYNTNQSPDVSGERAVHSIWYGALAELGYPGLALFIANFLMALWSCWRVVRLTKDKPEMRDLRIYANALVSVLVVYGVSGSFLAQQYNEMAWHTIGLSTALYFITLAEHSAGESVPFDPEGRLTDLTFIIPVRNDAGRLQRCLASIATNLRNHAGAQILVADNGSTDDSVNVARAAGAAVITVPGVRVSELRNRAASRATTSLLAFVDADHLLAPGWMDAALHSIAGDRVGAAGARYQTPPDGTWVQRMYGALRGTAARAHDALWLGSGNLVVKRAVFEHVGGFDAALEACEDVDLCQRIRAAGWRLVEDPKIASVHLGDPPTLAALFRAERWRGRNNIQVSLRGKPTLREWPSVLIPPVELASLMIVATGGVLWLTGLAPWWIPFTALAVILSLVFLRTARLISNIAHGAPGLQTRGPKDVVQALAVALTYDIARALALIAPAPHHRHITPPPHPSTTS